MITLTETAIKEIKKIIVEQKLDENTVVRVGVSGGGCSGFSYSFGFDNIDKFDENADTISESDGLRIVVDKKSDVYLNGTTVDFHEDLSKRGFVFNNPNAAKSCGCGSSFTPSCNEGCG